MCEIRIVSRLKRKLVSQLDFVDSRFVQSFLAFFLFFFFLRSINAKRFHLVKALVECSSSVFVVILQAEEQVAAR